MYGYSTESTTKKISEPYFWICAKAPLWGKKKKVVLNKEFEYKKKQTQKIPFKKTQYKEVWSNTLVNLSLKKKKKNVVKDKYTEKLTKRQRKMLSITD